jgi:uncharacterized protein YlxW (UPF0749 family)
MKLYFFIPLFIVLSKSQLAYSMNSKLKEQQKTFDMLKQNQEKLQQALNEDKKIVADFQQKNSILDREIESYKKRAQDALKAQNDIMMFNWILGSGIGIIIIACILYSTWESRALKNANRYRRIKY